VSSKEILLMAELIKMVAASWYTITDTEKSDAQGQGIDKLLWLIRNSGKMLVLAAIYGAMNILSFIALQYIGAGEFTICAQLKILTTAGFSVLILRTTLSWTRWRALALLVLGCTLVASPTFTSPSQKSREVYLSIFGYVAVLTEVALSGFASIYFEKVVKSTSEVVTIWERNVQLGFYSIIMYAMIIVYEWTDSTNTRAPWSNWSFLTLMVSMLGAGGGLLVAATLKYADSIMKTLAAAGAIVLSTVLGHIFLNGPLDFIVVIGGMCTIIAIANYTLDNTPTNAIVSSKPTNGDNGHGGNSKA
jgi:solute carrier family 35 (UDP-sugar transporter), member A1/2/3